jgi:transcriptional regulator with PAS, ATPase and Fis domain
MLKLDLSGVVSLAAASFPHLAQLPVRIVYHHGADDLIKKCSWPDGEPVRGLGRDFHVEILKKGTAAPVWCAQKCCFGGRTPDDSMLALSSARPFSEKDAKALNFLWLALSQDFKRQYEIAALREEAEFGSDIVQSMPSGFMVLKPDLKVINANKAACTLLRTTEEKLIGSYLPEFVLSKLEVRSVFNSGKAIHDREVFIRLADQDLHIMKTAVPVFDKNNRVAAVLDHFREIRETHKLVNRMTGAQASFSFDDIIYRSQVMTETVELGRMAAANSLSVLVTGESGTGKELVAHAVHMASPRRKGPFVVLDCASMPHDLVASELFGYMEGAFTGTRKGGMPGKFELANGGTIFLDELGELPIDVQAQFLRVVQNKEVRRLGGKDMMPVDIRVIAATNRDLAMEVKRGHFREDLYYRLNVLAIHIPPLRNRKEDLAVLIDYFLTKYAKITAKPKVSLSEEALAIINDHNWPGNVRELENVIARAVHSCESVVEPRHLLFPRRYEIMEIGAQDRERFGSNGQTVSDFTPGSEPPLMRDMERRVYAEALASCGGNISKAAKKLGVSRSTVYKKMALWNDGAVSSTA